VYLVGFTIEIYYDARSYKRQNFQNNFDHHPIIYADVFPVVSFLPKFPTTILHAFHFSPMNATSPAHHIWPA
jgi:hypothetical protein